MRPTPYPIAVAGYGEGGLLALYSAALDTRIDATLVSGYFQPREQVWKEPIYRDVWGLLRSSATPKSPSLIAPRALVVEASGVPQSAVRRTPTKERSGATPNGALATPSLAEVRAEVERARRVLPGTARAREAASGRERARAMARPARTPHYRRCSWPPA